MNGTTQALPPREILIFTDLDGSLLDHFGYQVEPADRLLAILETQHVPVIFCTSKTFSEVLELRAQLNNHHPFIVENGAAIYLPKAYFPSPPAGFQSSHHPDYLYHSFCESREHWLAQLDAIRGDFAGQFAGFSELGVQGIVRTTGLTEARARQANDRQFSEPVKWLGNDAQKWRFIEAMNQNGANIEQGGRFLHVIGHCDKGRALKYLRHVYEGMQTQAASTIAIGDGENDISMLEAADQAILIRSPVHPFPEVKQEQVIKSQHYGPHGWVESLQKVLKLNLE